ncbi:MAG: ATPase [Candidatus Gastranaerophilales bacterium]|nr:ATPase [Candidatus Gastranaerophilales bacterium]
MKLYADAGTTWSKVIELYNNENEPESSVFEELCTSSENISGGKAFLLPTKVFSALDIQLDGATGHMAKQKLAPGGQYRNEIVALAYGAKKRLGDLKNATIIDIGSRDIKWIKFKDNKFQDLDWNGSCGSATGATADMLCKYYDISPEMLVPQRERIPVTCGVFAMEKIMDSIVSDIKPEVAVAQYINGIAYNAWSFAKNPDKIYLSGGFCQNTCFVESLKFYCEVELLGRYILVEGLY